MDCSCASFGPMLGDHRRTNFPQRKCGRLPHSFTLFVEERISLGITLAGSTDIVNFFSLLFLGETAVNMSFIYLWIQTVLTTTESRSKRFEPSSRTFLNGEQPYPWNLLQLRDKMSRPHFAHTSLCFPHYCGRRLYLYRANLNNCTTLTFYSDVSPTSVGTFAIFIPLSRKFSRYGVLKPIPSLYFIV